MSDVVYRWVDVRVRNGTGTSVPLLNSIVSRILSHSAGLHVDREPGVTFQPERPSGDKAALSGQRPRRPPKRNQVGYRETPEYAEFAFRVVRRLGDRVGEEDPDALLAFRGLKAEVKKAEARAVAGLRRGGYSDRDIGRAIGRSQPAVSMKWPRGEEWR